MPVSANTLFHFTSLDSLKKILLSEKFLPSYSEEHFKHIVPEKLKSHNKLLVPLASFCDLTIIQLARDSKHTRYYHKYGIGLKKEWGTMNRISPVTYVHKLSPPVSQINTLYNLTSMKSTLKNLKKMKEQGDKIIADLILIKRHMTDAFKYLKPYSGNWLKDTEYDEEITYYNEREWRFCPPMDDFEVLFKSAIKAKSKKQYQRKLKIRNTSMQKFSSVKFTTGDIKYIIVDKEEEVKQFAKWIERRIKNEEAQSILIPKLISFEKIENDF